MIRRPCQLVVVCVSLLLSGLSAAWAHPQHPSTSHPQANAPVAVALSGIERGASTSDPDPRAERASSSSAAAAAARGCALSHHGSPSPLALAAGGLALLAFAFVGRRRPLALGLALVIAMASFEGVFHAALHLHHVSHPDGLTIGASASAPTALSPEPEIPTTPTPILLGAAPESGDELGAGVGLASHRGRAPPARPA